MRARRRGFGVALSVLGLAACACAHSPKAEKDEETEAPLKEGESQVIVGPGVFERGALELAAWLKYGSAKADLYKRHRPPPSNQSADDFDLELGARQAQSEFWAAQPQRAEDKAPHPVLDRQEAIWRAGYLPELVVGVYAKPGWTIPAQAIAGLRILEFATKFTGDYDPFVPVVLKPATGKLRPDVPGADFPDPADLPYGPESCGRKTRERRAAWVRWATLEPRFGGAPVSASSTLDFAHQLMAMKDDPVRRERGATWVSERVGHLAAVEGFCAVEAHDWRLAHDFLTRAVALRPTEPSPRIELSMALIQLGRLQDALAQADHVIAMTEDGCAVAAGWRRRGFILFDLADLAGARTAYQKSLEIEPGSNIALTELATIDRALSAAKTKPFPGFIPPPPEPMKVTHCNLPK